MVNDEWVSKIMAFVMQVGNFRYKGVGMVGCGQETYNAGLA